MADIRQMKNYDEICDEYLFKAPIYMKKKPKRSISYEANTITSRPRFRNSPEQESPRRYLRHLYGTDNESIPRKSIDNESIVGEIIKEDLKPESKIVTELEFNNTVNMFEICKKQVAEISQRGEMVSEKKNDKMWRKIKEQSLENEAAREYTKQYFSRLEMKLMDFQHEMDERDIKIKNIIESDIENMKNDSLINSEQIHPIIMKALKSILLPVGEIDMDYAAENQGGSIFNVSMIQLSEVSIYVMGLKLYSVPSTAKEIIRPTTSCWEFGGSSAEVILKLSKKIDVTGFSIEHVFKNDMSCAPKDFSVSGIRDNCLTGECEHEFGVYTYEWFETLVQKFIVKNSSNDSFQLIRVSFLNNWGNSELTCVHRFKVHGNATDVNKGSRLENT
ncbi:SUN domain-containing protein 1 [Nymphon striatum]|nr:SUN domain-containing protein 1 [Nymphon striatum]